MAVTGVFRNGFIQVNGVNLSDHAREISLEMSTAELQADVHGGGNGLTIVAGLEDWTVTATFLQDFAAGSVDATVGAMAIGATGGAAQPTTGVPIIVGGDSVAAVSSTNPRYSGNCIVTTYQPFGSGGHGTLMETSCTFRPSSVLTRRIT